MHAWSRDGATDRVTTAEASFFENNLAERRESETAGKGGREDRTLDGKIV